MNAASQLFVLGGRVALVTGAAGGLGRAIAAGLADAGAFVVLADVDFEGIRTAATTIEEAGGRAEVYHLDVTDRAAVAACVEAVERRHTAIDILVNCAGINTWASATDLSPEVWARILDVNLNGTFYCCQAVGRGMLERGRGSIVNMASIAGVVGHAGVVAYAVSKAGVIQLTRTLAVEWAPVRVNALAPSTFETPLVRRNRAQRPETYEALLRRIPLGRTGDPAEIVGPVLFLASDAASMVTGHVLAVDGGYLAS